MRIIGYNDPRKLNEIEEWNELKGYYHFCISQTLVQGLSREYKRTEFTVLTTIDKLIKKFYKEWTDNPQDEVNHYLDIRRAIEKIEDIKLRKSFMENRLEVYNSVKFLLECGVSSDQLERDDLTKDKKEFLNVYKEIENNFNWSIIKELDLKTIYSFKEAIKEIIVEEIVMEVDKKRLIDKENIKSYMENDGKEFKALQDEDKILFLQELINILNNDSRYLKKTYRILKERLELYKYILVDIEKKEIKKIIFHGIHQFTPIIIKLIKYLEQNNIEVIFLINYNEEFKRLYSTWDRVYDWTGCEIEKNVTEYKYHHLNIAQNYAAIVEGKFDKLTENNIVVNKYDNYTSMANYIAKIYLDAKDRTKGDIRPDKVLGNMKEQFYSVDGTNINDILHVYFPEQFEKKHFLAYPVGQLILAIYNLWDEKSNKIRMKESIIKECLATNLWTRSNKELYSPIEIFECIKVYFSDLENAKIEDYMDRIDLLISKIKGINRISSINRKKDYKKLGFYRVDINEIEFFKRIISDIKDIINELMGNGEEVNMISHYKNLLTLINDRLNDKDKNLKEEIHFVKEIDNRLSRLDSNSRESIAEIKETLQFYLIQNKSDDGSNWIVRDFNQIDGGVLLADKNAKERSAREIYSTYHFMEVSDNDMQGKSKVKLSWPLDEEFIGNSTEILKIINTCKAEYKNYLRCTLFYALFYIGETDIIISYIENKDDNLKEELYYILKMLNLKEKNVEDDDIRIKKKEKSIKSNELVKSNSINQIDIVNYNFCEERFLYESLIEGDGFYTSEFQIKQYLKNFIAISLYQNSNIKWDKLTENIKEVIPYASSTTIDDIAFSVKEKVEYFKKHNKIDEFYKELIKNYIFAKFTGNDINENLTSYKRQNSNEVLDYLNGNVYKGKKDISDKCIYCKYRNICIG